MNDITYIIVTFTIGFVLSVLYYKYGMNQTQIQYFNQKGEPLANGKIWLYEKGSTTPKEIFLDDKGEIPDRTLPADGFKIVLFDCEGIIIWSRKVGYE